MVAHKYGSLRSTRLGMLDAALPLHHRPAGIIVLRHLAEDPAKINLPIAKRTEPARPVDPILITAINARPPTRMKLRVFDVKGANSLVIEIEEGQLIHLLQNHVAGIEENIGARMIANRRKKPLEGCAIVQVFARMQFIANVNA